MLGVRSVKSVWSGAGSVVRQPAMMILLATVYLSSSSTTSMFSLFGIYVTQLGGSMGDVGLANAASALSEMPVLFFGGRILERFGGRVMPISAMLTDQAVYLRLQACWSVPAERRSGVDWKGEVA